MRKIINFNKFLSSFLVAVSLTYGCFSRSACEAISEEADMICDAEMPTTIDEFCGKYDFLSNFYLADVEYEGIIYPTVEHAFQAAKSLDLAARARFADRSVTPAQAAAMGREVDLREDWQSVKEAAMFDACMSKFLRHPDLKQRLLETGDAVLIEGNNHGDREWGMVRDSATGDLVGNDKLGKILMQIRDEFRNNGDLC